MSTYASIIANDFEERVEDIRPLVEAILLDSYEMRVPVDETGAVTSAAFDDVVDAMSAGAVCAMYLDYLLDRYQQGWLSRDEAQCFQEALSVVQEGFARESELVNLFCVPLLLKMMSGMARMPVANERGGRYAFYHVFGELRQLVRTIVESQSHLPIGRKPTELELEVALSAVGLAYRSIARTLDTKLGLSTHD